MDSLLYSLSDLILDLKLIAIYGNILDSVNELSDLDKIGYILSEISSYVVFASLYNCCNISIWESSAEVSIL